MKSELSHRKPKIVETIKHLERIRKGLKGSVGFVPTMGCLHQGHISLIKLAKSENDSVVVSIFVNPTQFEKKKDFRRYPRSTKRDLDLLKSLQIDCAFLPTAEEIYNPEYSTYVEVNVISDYLEGKIRPEHFKGVATIVNKLFNIIQPTRAYFGQKDAQQVILIKKMVDDLNIPVEIVVGETIREPDGLAMSSRNVFLNKKERGQAVILYKSLLLAQKLFQQGEKDSKKIKSAMKKLINTTSHEIDYISVADLKTLKKIPRIEREVLVSLAVRFGNTRLIDNIILSAI